MATPALRVIAADTKELGDGESTHQARYNFTGYRKLRAFDAQNGKLLWEADLPFAGNATPSTYMIDGKQYLVIAASGMRDRKAPQGAAYVAFALP